MYGFPHPKRFRQRFRQRFRRRVAAVTALVTVAASLALTASRGAAGASPTGDGKKRSIRACSACRK
ncbi:hypothetical protein, partial [Microbispora rosea]